MFARALGDEFAREVRVGLTGSGQKTLPCRYLYDDVGSALFDAITCLDEYGLTRADTRILQAHAGDLIDFFPGSVVLAELGSGSGAKTRAVLEALRCRQHAVYYPIDLSGSALEKCAHELGELGSVIPLRATYLDGLREVANRRAAGQRLLLLFLGSSIGNFEPHERGEFLSAIRSCLQPGDAMLLGTDLVKFVDRLIEAYDDPTGVTAAFNRNLLTRINRELDADFDVRCFDHVVRYHPAGQRIEMHLRAQVAQTVHIPKANLTVEFAGGETILTESCYKFRREQIDGLASAAGFRVAEQWVDEEWPFAESLLVAV